MATFPHVTAARDASCSRRSARISVAKKTLESSAMALPAMPRASNLPTKKSAIPPRATTMAIDVAPPHRLAQHERREEQHPDHARVLQEDRVRRRRPLRGDDERRQARAVADDGRRRTPACAATAPCTSRAEDEQQRDGREERAIERHLQRRIGDGLDADAARRPEQRRHDDVEDASGTFRHAAECMRKAVGSSQ